MPASARPGAPANGSLPWVVSGRSADALRAQAERLAQWLAARPGLDPADATGRTLLRNTFTVLGDTSVATVSGQAERSNLFASGTNTLTIGAEYQHSRFDSVNCFGDAPSLDVYAPVYGAAITRPDPYANTSTLRGQSSAYASDRLRFDNGLVVSASGRENVIHDDIHDRLANSVTKEDTNKFVWQGGLAFVGARGWVPHVSYTESFLPVSGTDLSGHRYVPETGQQYEAGLRYQPAPRGMVGATVFDLRRQNVLTPDPANPSGQVQTGEVQSKGVELEAEEKLPVNLSLTASYTYQDVKITKSNASDVGRRPPAIPTHMTSAWLYQHIRAGGPRRDAAVGLGIRYQGATLDSSNTVQVDGVTLVDAVGSYTINGVRFAVNAQNLFNKTFVAGCNTGTCYYGRLRSLYLTTTVGW